MSISSVVKHTDTGTPIPNHPHLTVEEAIDSLDFGNTHREMAKLEATSIPAHKLAKQESSQPAAIPSAAPENSIWITHSTERLAAQTIPTSVHPQPRPFRWSHLRVTLRTPAAEPISAILDTASGISLISSEVARKHYPDAPLTELCKPIALSGIGSGPNLTHSIELPVDMPDKKKFSWKTSETAYVVDDLSCGILLGLSYLKGNRLHIVWGQKDKNDTIKIGDSGREAWATCTQVGFAERKTARISAAETLVILPGEGRTIRVVHRAVPIRADGYLVEPQTISDPRHLVRASLQNGIVDGQSRIMTMANLGEIPVTIHKGQTLGILRKVDLAPDLETFVIANATSDTPTAIPITALLGVEPPPDEPEGRYPDGYPFNLPVPDPEFDIDEADIPDCWGEKRKQDIKNLILRHARLFSPQLGRFNDGIEMGVPFKQDADLDNLKQRPYNLSRRDRAAFDSIIDPLREVGAVENVPLGHICPCASPAFIVWRNDKPRVVVDLRRVNDKLVDHGYAIPRQDDIRTALGGSTVFTIMDILKGFFQQPLKPEDKWKTTFVTPHRGLQRLTVSTMGLKTSPAFFQHRMDGLFGQYLWQFVLVYIDDIIVFSKTIEQHLQHLEVVFTILENSGCTMSLPKCHFARQGVNILGHFVSRLGLSTTEEKTEAIRNLAIPGNLQLLEIGLGLMGYYREYVADFAIIADPLNEMKTLGFKDGPRAGQPRLTWARKFEFPPKVTRPPSPVTAEQETAWQRKQEYVTTLWNKVVKAWEKLKKDLINAVDLAFPDFEKPFILYVDTSGLGIGASLHQMQPNGKSRPILFLSRTLSTAESHYFAPELETLGLVWALDKLSYILDHSKIQVVTDHTSIVAAFDAANRLPRNVRRITKWRLFLSRYAHQLSIIHRPGKEHINADALSRLPKTIDEHAPKNPLLTMTEPIVRSYVVTRQQMRQLVEPPPRGKAQATDTETVKPPEQATLPPTGEMEDTPGLDVPLAQVEIAQIDGQVVSTLQMSKAWQDDVVSALANDPSFGKIYQRLVKQHEETADNPEGPDLTLCNFRFHPDSRLLYFTDGDRSRLVIPSRMQRRVLHMAHNERAHVGVNRVYHFLRDLVFFYGMRKTIQEHCAACAVCGLNNPPRHAPFGDLQPLETPQIPLSVLCLDFIVGLPPSRRGNDAILLIVCKTSKFVFALAGKVTYTTEDWARLYLEFVYPSCGFPDIFVSDMDTKFVSEFWKELCKATGTEIRVTAAHHSAANGQIERVVQTVMLAFTAGTGALFDATQWDEKLPHVIFVMNTSVSATTRQVPSDILYGRKLRGFQLPLANPSPTPGFAHQRQIAREEAGEAVQIAQARMKIYYDAKHTKPPSLDVGDYVYVRLAKPGHRGYHLNHQTKLTFRKTGPFRIAQKISPLKYKIELPSWLTWHPEMSIEHLVPASKEQAAAIQPSPGALTIDDNKKYIIEAIVDHGLLKKRRSDRQVLHYEVKWMGYDGTTWEPHSTLITDVPKLIKEYRSRKQLPPSPPSANL